MKFSHTELMRALKQARDVKDANITYREGAVRAAGAAVCVTVELHPAAGEHAVRFPDAALRFLDTLGAGDVDVEQEDGALRVKLGTSKARFPLPVGDEYTPPDLQVTNEAQIPGCIKAMIETVRPMLAPEKENKDALSCVHLKAARGTLYAEASDGRSAARVSVPCEGDMELLMTADSADKLCKLMGPEGATAQTDGRRVCFRGVGWEMTCAMHAGTYINLDMFLEQGRMGTRLSYRTGDMREAATRAAIARTRNDAMRMDFARGEVRVEAQSESCEYQGAVEELTGESVQLLTAVDSSYLLRALSKVQAEQLELLVSDRLLLLRARMETDNAIGNYEAVILPVRVH